VWRTICMDLDGNCLSKSAQTATENNWEPNPPQVWILIGGRKLFTRSV
jgi:hypothetical protein